MENDPVRKESVGRRLAEALSPLRLRPFRMLWTGQTVSALGNSMSSIALLFAVLHVGGSASDIGLVLTAQTVVRVVLILAGGVWADRLPRQVIMLTCDLTRAVVQAGLAVLLFTGHATVWELGCGAVLFGAAQAFFGPASAGLLPETVGDRDLQQCNALMNSSGSIFAIVGPALAGLIVAVWGAAPVFVVDAATFVVSAITLSRLGLARRLVSASASFREDLTAGWREVTSRRWFWTTLLAHGLWNFAIAAFFVLGPVIAERRLGGASAWGTITAADATGAVLGGLVSLRFRPARPLVAGNLALLLTALPLLALALPAATWVVAGAALLSGIGLTFLGNVWAAVMQELIPDAVRSRVDSYDWMLSMAVAPIGMALAGPAANWQGNAGTLITAALLVVVPCALTTLVPEVRAVRRAPDGGVLGPELRESDRTPDPVPLSAA